MASPLRLGAVPEHFSLPFHLAAERGIFAKYNVNVQFIEQATGTGAMIQAVKSGDLDIIVALTEGLVADIANQSDLRLLGTYVASPLCWAVSVGKAAPITGIEDLRGKRFGISRFGSGSHLMICVLANQRGWDLAKDVQFVVKGNFQALRDSVNDGSTDAFIWETFMTKPYHDRG
eukprot:m.449718 g.449718  ORF g.449718 m.449718 type:complete len:175 (+) comp56902_c0_seq10:44-568(+)